MAAFTEGLVVDLDHDTLFIRPVRSIELNAAAWSSPDS